MRNITTILGMSKKTLVLIGIVLAVLCVGAGGDGEYSDGNFTMMLLFAGGCFLCYILYGVVDDMRERVYAKIKRERRLKKQFK